MRPVRQAPALGPVIVTAVGAVLLSILFFANPFEKAIQNQLLGLTVMAVGGLPIVQWSRNPRSNLVPVLEIVGLFYAVCYGFAGLITPNTFMSGITVSEDQYTPALISALISLISIYMAFNMGGRIKWPMTPKVFQINDYNMDQFALYVGLPVGVFFSQLFLRLKLGTYIAEPMKDFFLCWVLYALFRGRYSRTNAWISYLVAIPIYLLLYLRLNEGSLAGVLTLAFVFGISYVAGTKRVPVLVIVPFLFVGLALQPVKGEYRQLTNGRQIELGPIEGALTFASLAGDQYFGNNNTSLGTSLNDGYSRINHLQTLAAIIAVTPEPFPYRYGETYVPLLTKWIPRAFWPDKPREDLGNRWAHDYRFVGQDDFVTSYNLPWLAEMYMNFGWAGVVGVSALVGLLMSAIWNVMARDAVLPSQFAATMTFSSVFFFPESNLSIGIGVLVIALFTVTGLSALLSAFSQRRLLRFGTVSR